MIDIVKPVVSGQATFIITKDSGEVIELTSKNAVLPNYKYLLAKLLQKDANANVTNIRVYNGTSLLSDKSITTFTYVDPNEVSFTATFDATSFNSSFTKVTLGTATPLVMGDFSEITSLALSKNGTESLTITWNIKFN
jgi:hypothetical protein